MTAHSSDKMTGAFFINAALLQEKFGIVPLLYGSLGLEFLTGEDLSADDIDILIPGEFVRERWPEFRVFLEKQGYVLTDEHEHTFSKDGIGYSYARVEGLDTFAGIPDDGIALHEREGIRFRLLDLEQYLSVYKASSKDGYRVDVRGKKDAEKIALIERLMRERKTKQICPERRDHT